MTSSIFNPVLNPSTFTRLGSQLMNSQQTSISPKRAIGLAITLVLGLSAFAGNAQAVTADDVVCSGCVGTSDLGNNAVTGAKIQNNTITGEDVASESLDRNDIKDEPGIDTPFFNGTHSGVGLYSSMSPTYWLPQQQITITHPAPGWVYCLAQGTMKWNVNGSRTGYLGWSDSSLNNVAPQGYSFSVASASGTHQAISAMRAFRETLI